MGLFWMYTGLRVLVFLVLFGALWLVGVRGLLGALIALVLGIPLSIFVLAGPRARLAAALQDHVDARNEHQMQLRRRLNGDELDGDDVDGDEADGDEPDPLDPSAFADEPDEVRRGDPRAHRPDSGR